VTITAPANPVDGFSFTVTFSHAVVGFTAADLTLTNATAGTVTPSGNSYIVAVAPTLLVPGTVTASIAAAAVSDGNGYPNNAASKSVSWRSSSMGTSPSSGGGGGGGGGCGMGAIGLVLLGLALLFTARRIG
jgi:hypothetical protein